MGKNKAGNTGGKQWMHPPEALLKGHVVYHVKFLGHVEVEQPKGTEMVRDAIRKMKFNKQLKKAEGQKPPKVELTISVDGVTVQEPKYKVIEHQYPLHRISYCADDKSDKRMFTFIAKEANSNSHHCFVFDSDKCAEEITLTIGQAFNLAYKKFIETSSKDIDVKKQYLLTQKKVQQLTQENLQLKERVAELERLVDPQVLDNYERNKQNGATVKPASVASPSSSAEEVPVVGRKLENLLFDDEAPAPPARPTNGVATMPASAKSLPVLAPPPPVPSRNNLGRTPQKSMDSGDTDLFGQTPFTATTPTSPTPPPPSHNPSNPFGGGMNSLNSLMMSPQQQAPPANSPFYPSAGGDPFGMGSFTPTGAPKSSGGNISASGSDLDRQILSMDQELMDLKTGFSQGLTFGTEDFSLASLDPLNNS